MPNIELHGFLDSADMRKIVWSSLFGTDELRDFADEVVVTTFPSQTNNRQGRQSPFVRVYFEDKRELELCKHILSRVAMKRKVAFDAEFVCLALFLSFPPRKHLFR